jgi:hypothetical protein
LDNQNKLLGIRTSGPLIYKNRKNSDSNIKISGIILEGKSTTNSDLIISIYDNTNNNKLTSTIVASHESFRLSYGGWSNFNTTNELRIEFSEDTFILLNKIELINMVEGMGWLMPQPETVNLTKLH